MFSVHVFCCIQEHSRGMETVRGDNSVKTVLPPFCKKVYSLLYKGKVLLLLGANSFLLKIAPLVNFFFYFLVYRKCPKNSNTLFHIILA